MSISYLELYHCLRSFDAPFPKADLIILAKKNGASEFVLNCLERLQERVYANLHEVIQEIIIQQNSEEALVVN